MPIDRKIEPVRRDDLFASLPPVWEPDPLPQIQTMLRDQAAKVVVLDDDPTGTGTLHGIPALTTWTVETLADELRSAYPTVYLIVNSRAMQPEQANAVNREIGRNLREASRQTGRAYVVLSRGDSTLRGHYPNETDALAEGLSEAFDNTLLIPAFIPGGRFTVDDVHYAADGEWLIPAGQTQFARDSVFGYQSSNLKAWVEEKTKGRVKANDVASISIDLIRRTGPDAVTGKLLSLPRGTVCIVNAAAERDLAVAALGIMQAEARGRRFMYRTAASMVPVRAGIAPRPLLTAADLNLPQSGGGLVVVGSYIPMSTAQVQHMLAHSDMVKIEIMARRLLSDAEQEGEIERAASAAEAALERGDDVLIYTSRELISGLTGEGSLEIGTRISDSVTRIVRQIGTRPRYLLAKGGITSNDVATIGCGIRRAMVLGQILPGVPVWRMGDESRYPGMVYVIFPGNVGAPDSIAEVVAMLKGG